MWSLEFPKKNKAMDKFDPHNADWTWPNELLSAYGSYPWLFLKIPPTIFNKLPTPATGSPRGENFTPTEDPAPD